MPDRSPSIFDPGWLFVIAGGVIFAATALIPAYDDAHAAERQVEQAEVWAIHQTTRVERYSEYLDALVREDPTLMASLVTTHLHLRPEGKRAILFENPELMARQTIDDFANVEPAPPRTPPPPPARPHRPTPSRSSGRWRTGCSKRDIIASCSAQRRPASPFQYSICSSLLIEILPVRGRIFHLFSVNIPYLREVFR